MNLLSHLDSFNNNQKIISYNQSTSDIINAILKQHNKNFKDYDKLYYFFDQGTCYKTAKKVFNYLKNNIKYVIEPENLQTVKTPAAILATGKTTGSDCKNYSLFFAGIMDSYRRNTGENFDLCFRFASYDGSNIPEHVFVVINPNTNNEICCDAVLSYFNEKKEPNYFKDKKIKNMALMALSGINNFQPQQMNGVFDDVIKIASGDVTGGVSGLLSGLLKGHSDYYYYDLHYIQGKDDLVIEQAITWFNKGLSINQFDFSRIWSDTATKIKPKRRIEMLVDVYNRTKRPEIIPIINTAVKAGLLPDSAKISTGTSLFKNLFGGGETTPGQPGQPGQASSTGGISTTMLIGGVAAAGLIAFLIFKKK